VALRWLLALVPVSLLLGWVVHPGPIWVFLTAVVAIVPLADLVRQATEELAHETGSAIGGLLNVTFGNAAELILALFVLAEGHVEVVKAQITGSLIGNSLLGLGLAILVGSIGRQHQRFSRERAGLVSSLLTLSVIALLVPALFDHTERQLGASGASLLDERLSLGVAAILIAVYAAHLVYRLVTHRDVFAIDEAAGGSRRRWSLALSLAVLVAATALVAAESELVSASLEATAGRLGLSTFFLGIVVLAIVGNAAEYVAAVYFARRDRMDLVITLTAGSSIQVALLTAPLLVFVSRLFARPMTLVFENPLELIAVAAAAITVRSIAADGESTWFEGALLLAVYAVLALAFFFM
jgi:Ca2+:H+ antiporter